MDTPPFYRQFLILRRDSLLAQRRIIIMIPSFISTLVPHILGLSHGLIIPRFRYGIGRNKFFTESEIRQILIPISSNKVFLLA